MQIENIQKLKSIIENRERQTSGYKDRNLTINLSVDELVLHNGSHCSKLYAKHVKAAILELEDQIIKRAIELEEIEFKQIEKLAKIESANILSGETII